MHDDQLQLNSYVNGDLVVYTGELRSPELTYDVQLNEHNSHVDIVVRRAGGHGRDKLYQVYWLRHAIATSVPAAQLRLAYKRNNNS